MHLTLTLGTEGCHEKYRANESTFDTNDWGFHKLFPFVVSFGSKKHGLRPPTREVADHAMFPVIRTSPNSSETDSEYSVLWRVQDKHITVAVTIAFLLYSTVSTVIFQVMTV